MQEIPPPIQVLNGAAPRSCNKTGADKPEKVVILLRKLHTHCAVGEGGGLQGHALRDRAELEPQ